ncbi:MULTISPECIES: lactococcin 972 family bacteriocin [Streptococcus]|uniref:Lactococcin 972 family bacteriocin n=1 Tax=Streptococcus suis TaxID=1307 RepID=A0A3S6K324_STRSU|nr:lactococcin 972 family bacteriocin [Streptococcus suis]ASW49660.1 bacteriocin, lactococcin family protein [Streptococcus suis]NQM46805.1 lactococcin 972 family bacteriocin [Streptococcus suis]HEL1780429.1 lactococcin 972 family bacteriocin [Streptococcus suis]HEL2376085.1 lactococcin 972 family bacteriocin [Streptococcus suis]HEL2692275.1 lactococcin 972 family bacteriocin [Streptococcus suis]
MLKIRTVVMSTLTLLMFSVFIPVFAVSHLGGEWTYGGHHDPGNWGAFSNYYHGSSWHWSYVGSTIRNNQKKSSASAGSSSYAFINTDIGEHVVFDAGK